MIAVLMCFFREIPRFSKEKWLNMFLELIQYAHRIILNSVFLLYTYKESAISHLFTIQSRQQQEWFNLLQYLRDHFHRVSLLDNAFNYLVGCVIQKRIYLQGSSPSWCTGTSSRNMVTITAILTVATFFASLAVGPIGTFNVALLP